jgi:hypothetical protein
MRGAFLEEFPLIPTFSLKGRRRKQRGRGFLFQHNDKSFGMTTTLE